MQSSITTGIIFVQMRLFIQALLHIDERNIYCIIFKYFEP